MPALRMHPLSEYCSGICTRTPLSDAGLAQRAASCACSPGPVSRDTSRISSVAAWGRALSGTFVTVVLAATIGVISADSLDKYKYPDEVSKNAPADEVTRAARIKQETRDRRGDHPILSAIADYRLWLIGLLTLGTSIPGAITAVRTRRREDNARKELIRRHLRIVRDRSFATQNIDGLLSKVRISLFVVETVKKQKQLACLYRTDDKQPKRAWPIDKDEGLVVRAYRHQVNFPVVQLDEAKVGDMQRYLDETWATPEIFGDRSWKGPTMLAIPITTRPGEKPIAVLLVEAIGVGLADSRLHETDADLCCMLLEEPL